MRSYKKEKTEKISFLRNFLISPDFFFFSHPLPKIGTGGFSQSSPVSVFFFANRPPDPEPTKTFLIPFQPKPKGIKYFFFPPPSRVKKIRTHRYHPVNYHTITS